MERVVKALMFLTLIVQAPIAQASITITEIMYDLPGTDTDREWVEIYNSSNTDIDITGYKFFEGNVNHGLTIVEGGNNLSAGAYAVIVDNPTKFKNDWPSFTGTILDSSFSLSNEGEFLAIKNTELFSVDELTYDPSIGALGDGNSLSKINGSWISATPTPGKANQNTVTTTTNTEESKKTETPNTLAAATNSGSVEIELSYQSPMIAGLPAEIKADVFGVNGEELIYGKLVWNFGDGSARETRLSERLPIKHTYFYGGEYVMTVEYYAGDYVPKPNATFRKNITVIDPTVSISRLGGASDYLVELANTSRHDIDVSGWYVLNNEQKFVLPKNTILTKNQKIILSPRVTNFVYGPTNKVSLFNQNDDLVFAYPTKATEKITTVKISSASAKNISSTKKTNASDLIDVPIVLSAAAASPQIIENEKPSSAIWFLFALVVVGAGVAVYVLRRGKDKEDDFEILSE